MKRIYYALLAVLLSTELNTASAQAPTINSFSPASGATGTAITINGTNFSANKAENVVYLGLGRATVQSATTTKLVVTAPATATYGPLQVINTNTKQVVYYRKPFKLTFSNANYTGLVFKEPQDLLVNPPWSVKLADIDGDGKTDMITSAGIHRNTSSGGNSSFAAPVAFPHGIYDIADVDLDGKPDMICAEMTGIAVYKNNSTPGSITTSSFTLTATASFANEVVWGYGPSEVEIADMDGDGRPDMVARYSYSITGYEFTHYGLLYYRNTSSGNSLSFAQAVNSKGSAASSSIALADVNGDNKTDIVLGEGLGISVFKNTATPGTLNNSSFVKSTLQTDGVLPGNMQVQDIDGDGNLDIIGLAGAGNFIFMRNTTATGTQNISFAPKVSLSGGPQGTETYYYEYNLSAGDFDGDGKPDLLMLNTSNSQLQLFRNTATKGTLDQGSFEPVEIVQTEGASATALGDMNGDSRPDLLVWYNSNYPGYPEARLRLYTNITGGPAPEIASFSPARGPVGTEVTINGNGFSSHIADNRAYLGTTPLNIIAATNTQLKVVIPAGIVYGPFSVVNLRNHLSTVSKLQFNITHPAATIIPKSKVTPLAFNADLSKVADIDGDGVPDLVTMDNSLRVYRNVTTPTADSVIYAAPANFTTGQRNNMVLADITGDGKPDVIAGSYQDNTVMVLVNTSTVGNINFSLPSTRQLGGTVWSKPNEIAVGDIDGDGRPDIVVADEDRIVFLHMATTRGLAIFGNVYAFVTGYKHKAVKLADIDGDGKLDVITASKNSPIMFIARNRSVPGTISASSFDGPVAIATTDVPNGVNTADIDSDGKPDIIINYISGNAFGVYRNKSIQGSINSASLAAGINIPGQGASSIIIMDADGDGKPDILAPYAAGSKIFRNNSSAGNITAASFLPLSSDIKFTEGLAADMNNDGRQDIVSGDKIWLNGAKSVTITKPVIASFNPLTARTGESVTLNGENFGARSADNIVYFGAVQAEVTEATPNKLVVRVPAGATYETVSVINKTTGLTGNSSRYFVKTLSSPKSTIEQADFEPPVDLDTKNAGLSWGIGSTLKDIDGDGRPDLAGWSANGIAVMQNKSSVGTFNFPSITPLNSAPLNFTEVAIIIDDIDNDGRQDIIYVAKYLTGSMCTITILRNISNGGNITASSFAPAINIQVPAGVIYALLTADIDRDGRKEIIVNIADKVYIYQNKTTPGTVNASSFAAAPHVISGKFDVKVADVDMDGYPDLLTTNATMKSVVGDAVRVYRNKAIKGVIDRYSFDVPVDFKMNMDIEGLTISDINADGKPDVLARAYGNNALMVMINATQGKALSLQAINRFQLLGLVHNAADINGDGKVDLIGSMDKYAELITNKYTSGWIAPSSYAVNRLTGKGWISQVCDMDGDGRYDLISINGNKISILRYNPVVALSSNRATADVTAITAVSPNGDGVNDVFTIDGIDKHPQNTVLITNSRGIKIFEAKGYNNASVAFNGYSTTGVRQEAGTYFYTVSYTDKGVQQHKSGYLVLKY
ncbi:hypothetical protein DJ568_00150 [Mucilaginibacter hurinus]|uniref:IPT/TIG domain-containing protein n=1 Tax=Mucilaginibacter hurinus TaxID=2201324 RepID=A0A367GUE9_9SPHI|nr:FG-GAP-like repeat-containing protein [Mucilaginibacter hurinus]RCH56313.1 hypothetical protein DJ568_00150 [Mucilaginibacter hurinus]